MPPSLIGQQLGRYLIKDFLGAGNMAEVYLGYQPNLDRHAAIKVIRPELATDEGFITRFRHEARAIANLRHPNIVQVYDFDEQDDRYFLVLEYIQGSTLQKRIATTFSRNELMPLAEVVTIMVALCDGLNYAHEMGVIHRDIKPANVMFTQDDVPVIADFGVAKIVNATTATGTNVLTGTPLYMSPEQAQGLPVDHRTDIYALGVLLFEMTTGRLPFDDDRPLRVLFKIVTETPPNPRDLNPNISPEVEAVILKTLSKSPDDRYPTANDLANALKQVAGTRPVAPRETPPLADSAPPAAPPLGPQTVKITTPLSALPRPPQKGDTHAGTQSLALPKLVAPNGAEFVLNRLSVILGRKHPEVGIDLTDVDPTHSVSRQHAQIVRRDNGFYIMDLNSLNGVKLNGKTLERNRRAKLRPGDEIQLGDVILAADLGAAEPEAAPRRNLKSDIPGGSVDRIYFSLTAPTAAAPGASFFIDLWAHLERQRPDLVQRAREAASIRDHEVQSKGPVPLRGAVLLASLRLDGADIEDPEDVVVWEGTLGNATFLATLPENTKAGAHAGQVTLYVNGLQIARLNFVIFTDETTELPDSLAVQEQRHRKAYVCYARADREAVLARVQALQKAAPMLELFLDAPALRDGPTWAQEMQNIIPAHDVFYLFWSENAPKSPWVEKEWRCALAARGLDFIDPAPLASPDDVPPPPEFAAQRFNEWVFAFMRSKSAGK